jgi:hypothetical protein
MAVKHLGRRKTSDPPTPRGGWPERRLAPAPVDLGLAARFLAPRQKSILTPVQPDLPSEVPEKTPEPGFARLRPS